MTIDLMSGWNIQEDSVGLLFYIWRKNWNVSPVTGVQSDRICAIQLECDGSSISPLTLIAGYLPCSNYPIQDFEEHLLELEKIASVYQESGSVLILGDFNAHLNRCSGDLHQEVASKSTRYISTQFRTTKQPAVCPITVQHSNRMSHHCAA